MTEELQGGRRVCVCGGDALNKDAAATVEVGTLEAVCKC